MDHKCLVDKFTFAEMLRKMPLTIGLVISLENLQIGDCIQLVEAEDTKNETTQTDRWIEVWVRSINSASLTDPHLKLITYSFAQPSQKPNP